MKALIALLSSLTLSSSTSLINIKNNDGLNTKLRAPQKETNIEYELEYKSSNSIHNIKYQITINTKNLNIYDFELS